MRSILPLKQALTSRHCSRALAPLARHDFGAIQAAAPADIFAQQKRRQRLIATAQAPRGGRSVGGRAIAAMAALRALPQQIAQTWLPLRLLRRCSRGGGRYSLDSRGRCGRWRRCACRRRIGAAGLHADNDAPSWVSGLLRSWCPSTLPICERNWFCTMSPSAGSKLTWLHGPCTRNGMPSPCTEASPPWPVAARTARGANRMSIDCSPILMRPWPSTRTNGLSMCKSCVAAEPLATVKVAPNSAKSVDAPAGRPRRRSAPIECCARRQRG